MNPERLRSLLESLARGEIAVADVVERIRHLPFSDIESARLDHHRELRTGMPEVVFGEGKTAEQIVAISREMLERSGAVLVTRDNRTGRLAALIQDTGGLKGLDWSKPDAISAFFNARSSGRAGTIVHCYLVATGCG